MCAVMEGTRVYDSNFGIHSFQRREPFKIHSLLKMCVEWEENGEGSVVLFSSL